MIFPPPATGVAAVAALSVAVTLALAPGLRTAAGEDGGGPLGGDGRRAPSPRSWSGSGRHRRRRPAPISPRPCADRCPPHWTGTAWPPRSADVLEWVWTHAVLPEWPARRRVLEADVIARAAQLSRGGWARAIDGMRPGMRWLGKSRLQTNAYDNPPRELDGAQMVFTPVTADVGWVCWDIPHRYGVVYPCEGALADTGRTPVPQALGALIGPARAGVLVLLASPLSTTQLTALTGQGLGSVGRHLRVLLDAGLVRRRRAGRSVL